MTRTLRLLALPALLIACTFSITADEGMYPLSEISRLNLKAKGLKIDAKEIYNPDGVSLVDAICRVNGGTGEFVSQEGLFLTNHHIAYSGVTAASTPEHDYLKNGFTARTRGEELPAKDYSCLICEKYRDVSADVLASATPAMTPAERSTALRAKMKDLAAKEQAGRANITCEVSEMFPGKSYVLFTYRQILDVRLVYVPPIGVGNFGGEEDNWVWPRHTGDFSFMRAYVAPDGSTRAYAKDNVPFRPKRWLKVAPQGVRENDFVMILGYPGRTFRHKVAQYMALQQDVQLPFMSSRFDRMISTIDAAAGENRALQLKYADDVKGYANAAKNYKGKIQGLRRLSLVESKRAEERDLQAHIDRDPVLKAKYGTTLADLARVYDAQRAVMTQELTYSLLMRNRLLALAVSTLSRAEAKAASTGKSTGEQDAKLQKDLAAAFDEADAGIELRLLAGAVSDALQLPSGQRLFDPSVIDGVDARASIPSVLAALEAHHPLGGSQEGFAKAMTMKADEIAASGDLVFRIAAAVRAQGAEIRERQRVRDGELTRLEADLLDAKMAWKKSAFIPDANSTLRLTYGYVRGCAPSDALVYRAQTTLRGVIEKNRGADPYDAPAQLVELFNKKSYNKAFEDPTLKDVPVAMLYNMDTTGGNSGSPVLNARGELVGVNFDRAYEATINDYQWSEQYSRSIGADIRYVLFIAKYLGGADFLLKELGVGL